MYKKIKTQKSKIRIHLEKYFLLYFVIIFNVCFYTFTIINYNESITKIKNTYKFSIDLAIEENKNLNIIIETYKSKIEKLEKRSFNSRISKAILNDMSKIDYISENEKLKIFNSIIKNSEIYNINPIVLYSVLFTESSLKPYMEHKETYIPSLKKRIKAVGLGGVVWEFWKDDLKKNNIAQTRQDLFEIETNIAASAYILNIYKSQNQLDKAKTNVDSMLMRYYGSSSANYEGKIYKKIGQLMFID